MGCQIGQQRIHVQTVNGIHQLLFGNTVNLLTSRKHESNNGEGKVRGRDEPPLSESWTPQTKQISTQILRQQTIT